MPRTNGIYSLPPGYQAVTGETIVPSQHNPPLEDIEQALTDSLPRDGSAPMTGNLAMGGNKITNIGAATTGGNVPRYDQVVHLVGDQTITGIKTFDGPVNFNNQASFDSTSGSFTFVSDGVGRVAATFDNGGTITGRIRIEADGTIDLEGANGGSFAVDGNAIVDETRTISTGDGLSGGGNLSANRTLTVNSSVARRSGGNTFTGNQIFNGNTDQDVNGTGLRLNSDGTVDRNAVTFRIGTTAQWNIVQRSNGNLNINPLTGGVFQLDGSPVVSEASGDGRYATLAGGNTFSGLQAFSNNVTMDINGSSLTMDSDGAQDRNAITTRINGTAQWNMQQRSGGNLNFVPLTGGNFQVGGVPVVTQDRSVSSGPGLTGGGALSANRTISMGTPSDITRTSLNEATGGTHTHRITQANFRDMEANFTGFGQIGSYVFAKNNGSLVGSGNTTAGSNLEPTSDTTGSGSSLAGTWRCMGYGASGSSTLWIRVS